LPGPCQQSTVATVGIAVPIQSQSTQIKDKVKAFLFWNFMFTMFDYGNCSHICVDKKKASRQFFFFKIYFFEQKLIMLSFVLLKKLSKLYFNIQYICNTTY
jgi:hypothetical protein